MLNVHQPVLLEEIVQIFNNLTLKVFVDLTVGAGGHAEAIMNVCLKNGIYVGFDRDPLIINIAKEKLKRFKDNVILINESYDMLDVELKKVNINEADAFLMDLGVSSLQLDSDKRGFSFQKDAPLDMRMDPRTDLTAYDVVNSYSFEELSSVLIKYSDIRKPYLVADIIVKRRAISSISTTKELADIFAKKAFLKRKKIHPATTIFQAIRIEVNDELNKLESGLKKAFSFLKPGGIIAVISFHSLEDRIVKKFFKEKALECICSKEIPKCICNKKKEGFILTSKAITPSAKEINNNKRARSAKLRVLCKI